MNLPINTFKQALAQGRPQIGLWLGWASAYTAEALAGTGFDWLLIDGEHVPNDVPTILAQLQAVDPYAVSSVVRPVEGRTSLIKQLLDIGAQTLLVPMVETAEEAEHLVRAMRYPPHGNRGVGAGLARAARWGQVDGYGLLADEQMCLLVQVETVAAMSNLDAIAAVEGVDGVFFGPADLSASMGKMGQVSHPDVHGAILDGIARARAAGKAAGVLAVDPKLARTYLDAGATFVAVGSDTGLLVRAARQLASAFKAG